MVGHGDNSCQDVNLIGIRFWLFQVLLDRKTQAIEPAMVIDCGTDDRGGNGLSEDATSVEARGGFHFGVGMFEVLFAGCSKSADVVHQATEGQRHQIGGSRRREKRTLGGEI